MIKNCTLLFLLAIFFFQILPAQTLSPSKWKEKRSGDEWSQNEDMEIFFYHYINDQLDLREFKTKLKPEISAQLPDFLKIVPPDFEGLNDTSYALAWLKKDAPDEGDLLVMICGNRQKGEPVFFIDWNMNQVFLADSKPILFTEPTRKGVKWLEKVRIKLDSGDPDEKSYEFWLMNPSPKPEEDLKTKAEPKAWDYFSMRIMAGMGTGKLQWRYIDPATNYPVTLNVSTTDKIVSPQLNFKHKNLNIILKGTYENLFYWSSEQVARLGEPYVLCGTPSQGCIHFENVLVKRDRMIFPKTRLSFGLALEYDVKLAKKVLLSPFVGAGISSYIPGKFIPERIKPEESFSIASSSYLETGLLLKLELNPADALLFQLSYQQSQFSPGGYFESVDALELSSMNWNARVNIGYQIGLW